MLLPPDKQPFQAANISKQPLGIYEHGHRAVLYWSNSFPVKMTETDPPIAPVIHPVAKTGLCLLTCRSGRYWIDENAFLLTIQFLLPRGVHFFWGQGGMKARIDCHSWTFLWLCAIPFQNVKFGLLGAGMALLHAPGQFRSKVISVDRTLLLVYIYNSASVCCHGIYIL